MGQSVFPASNVEMDALIAAQAGDSFAVSDNMGITGRVLWRLMGAAFEPHRNLATMNAVVASTTAMDAVAASAVAMDAIWASSTAWNIVSASNMAVGKYVAGRAGQTASAFADMDAVAASATAMNAVAASAVAMNAVAASTVAMNAVAASSTAMDAVATSAVALSAVCRSVIASSSATSALQSRRATIITTMNNAPTIFSRTANVSYHISTSGGNYDFNANTNSFVIPLSHTTTNSGQTYSLNSLANLAQIHSYMGTGATVFITVSVALSGIRVVRNFSGGTTGNLICDVYTAV